MITQHLNDILEFYRNRVSVSRNQITSTGHLIGTNSKALPHPTTEFVSRYGFTRIFGYRRSELDQIRRVRSVNNLKVSLSKTYTLALEIVEFTSSRKRLRNHLCTYASTALKTTSLQDCSTSAIGHTVAETMLLRTLTVIWLESSLHTLFFLLKVTKFTGVRNCGTLNRYQ